MRVVEVASFSDQMIAEMARAKLEAEGIHAIVFDGGIAGLGLGLLLPARVMVAPDDQDRALRCLADAI